MTKAQFDIKGPYDLALSLKFAVACRFESEGPESGEYFQRLIRIDNKPVFIRIETSGSIENPNGIVSWSCPEGGRINKETLIKKASAIISADLDPAPFYELAQKSKLPGNIVDKFYGLKPILTATVFESAAWAIMGQQVNLNFASKLKIRTTEKYGRKINMNGFSFSLFPEPDDLSRANINSLRKMQFSRRKAEYLLGLAKGIIKGDHDLESLSTVAYNDAVNYLISIRGLGIWSANYILMRGAGHLDCLPLGDSGLNRAVKNLFKLKDKPDNEKINRIAKKYMPYRSLFTLYLWYSLMMETWK